MAFSLANASSFLPFLVSGDFRNFSKFASGAHHVDGFSICDWLSHGHKADVLLVPLVFVVLVVFYFSTIFIIAAIALAKSALSRTTRQPGPQALRRLSLPSGAWIEAARSA
jgi:phage shock protein PspC (stress-responsive transcriptional regulator)